MSHTLPDLVKSKFFSRPEILNDRLSRGATLTCQWRRIPCDGRGSDDEDGGDFGD